MFEIKPSSQSETGNFLEGLVAFSILSYTSIPQQKKLKLSRHRLIESFDVFKTLNNLSTGYDQLYENILIFQPRKLFKNLSEVE